MSGGKTNDLLQDGILQNEVPHKEVPATWKHVTKADVLVRGVERGPIGPRHAGDHPGKYACPYWHYPLLVSEGVPASGLGGLNGLDRARMTAESSEIPISTVNGETFGSGDILSLLTCTLF